MTTTATRQEYIDGLRALVDILDSNPDLPLPYATGTNGEYASDRLTFYVTDREQLQALTRALPGSKNKQVNDTSEHFGFELAGQVHGLHYMIVAPRDQVCTRRVIAVREVVEEVPDPDALAAVPTVTVTRTVEDVEWDCHPLLAEQVPA